MLHGHGTCTWYMYMVHGTCTWYMYMVHVHGTCIWYIHMIHAYGACIWYMYMVHVYGICMWYMYIVYVHDHVYAYRFHFASGQLGLRRFFFGTIGPAALFLIFESYFRLKFRRCFNKRFGQNLLFSYPIISFDEGSGLSKEIGGRSTKNI